MESFDKNLGKLIRNKRRERDITQVELCTVLGVSQSKLSKIERGEQTLSAESFVKVIKKLKIPLTKIVELI